MKRCVVVATVLSVIAVLGNTAPASAGVRWGIGINIPLFWPGPCCSYPRYYYAYPPTVVYAQPPMVYYPSSTVYVQQSPSVTYVYPNRAAAPAAVQPVPAPTVQSQLASPPQQPVAQLLPQTVQDAPAVAVVPRAAEYIGMLSQGKDSDRKKAAKELRHFNAQPVIAALIDALQKDGSGDVRKEAADSLGHMRAPEAQPVLRQAARYDIDSGVRKAALKSAQKIEKEYGIQP